MTHSAAWAEGATGREAGCETSRARNYAGGGGALSRACVDRPRWRIDRLFTAPPAGPGQPCKAGFTRRSSPFPPGAPAKGVRRPWPSPRHPSRRCTPFGARASLAGEAPPGALSNGRSSCGQPGGASVRRFGSPRARKSSGHARSLGFVCGKPRVCLVGTVEGKSIHIFD